jgi:hypothetical protein
MYLIVTSRRHIRKTGPTQQGCSIGTQLDIGFDASKIPPSGLVGETAF